MAIVLVSGNLNTYGNNGQFETDPSTWGFSSFSPAHYSITRSSVLQSAGLYSLRAEILDVDHNYVIAVAQLNGALTSKKYVAKIKVRTPAGTPAGSAGTLITLRQIGGLAFWTEHDVVEKTITDATDTWTEVEWYFSTTLVDFSSLYLKAYLLGTAEYDGEANVGGLLYADEFTIHEYIDTDEPEPEPEPTPDQVYFHKNPITLGKTAASGWEAINNLRLFDDIRVEDITGEGTFNSKLKVALYPSADGSVVFYARQAFRNLLDPQPPTQNHDEIIRLTDRIKIFKHFTGVIQDDETEPGAFDESLPMMVLWGGISKRKFPGLNFFTEYLPLHKKFFTWSPTTKTIDRLQEDYLNFWVYNDAITTLKLQIKAYYDDTTDETAVTKTYAGSLYGQLFQIPAGASNSGALIINPAKNLVKYELSLLNQDDEVISEVRTFQLTSYRHPLTRYIMLLNSLGSFEVMRFVGAAEETTDVQRELVQKFLPHDYLPTDGEVTGYRATMQVKKNLSTGHFKDKYSTAWLNYMREILVSPKVFDVTTGERVRLNVLNTSMQGKIDNQYEMFARFDVADPYIDESYTPDDVTPDAVP